ncbi:MAG TPA: bifunctional adenosylcobinamide kinase/adenosylcobinamide-phosphate guanylyltransferase [Thermoanaerobacterales bacterium]|nr:bifunctional adenosylcobinamide kinase/adenosylcobinamide-phosphate guanylyltransferase [Thermoanaerobacterales bacterium]
MDKGKFFFITGGARSGKSTFAEKLALSISDKVLYIATSEVLDEEMARRVELHKSSRPPSWKTIEEPLNIDTILTKCGNDFQVVLVDCLTLFVTNHLFDKKYGEDLDSMVKRENEIHNKVKKLAEVCVEINSNIIVVSNEVGMGLVPDNPLGRFYRDILGRSNQVMANKAHEVYFMVSGLPIKIK